MSDFNSSLPVRTESAGDVVAKIVDGTTTSQALSVDASGRIIVKLTDGGGVSLTSQVNGSQRALDVGINVAGVQVDPRAIRALTSTDVVSVVQSTSPWIVKDVADGSISGGTAGTFSSLAGLIFNTAAPTLTNGQQASLQADSAANLLVNLKTALPAGGNVIGAVTQSGGPWTVTGTGTAGSAATGVVTVQGIAGGTAIPISGTVTASNPSVGTDGSAIPTSSTLIGASDGTNLQQLLVESSSNRNLRIGIYNGANEAAVKAASTAPVAADPALVVTLNPNNAANTVAWLTTDSADGSVAAGTAGTKSMLGGLVFNTSAPTLTNGQQVALQGDSSGNLKVNLITAIPTGANTIGIVNQGTAASAANGWFARLTDGTNNVAVKAASTAAVVGDPSLVVALSPNSPLPTGTNNIGNVGVLVGGAANSFTNPLFVTSLDTLGTPVDAYNTSAAVASAATATYNYTVTAAKTFLGEQLWVSGSGKLKVELQFETAAASGTFVTYWVGFNSTSDTNILIPMTKSQVASAKIRTIITNLDKQAQDVYTTLSGNEV